VEHLIRKLKILKPYSLILAIILVCVLLTFINIRYVKANQGGNDFLTNWTAARDLFLKRQSPYSVQTTQDIQKAIYGRLAETGEVEYKFFLPLYGVFLYAPFSLAKDFSTARALWMTFLEVGVIAILLLSIQLTYWKVKPLIFSALILFGVFGFHGIIPLLDGNLIILVTLLTTCILLFVRNKQDEAAGLLLAILTINLTPAFLFFVFILVWAVANHRSRLVVWFLGAFALLIGFSVAIIPGWIFQFLNNFISTYKAIQPGSPGEVLISRWGAVGNRFSIVISTLIGILMIVEWWQANRAGMKRFVWTATLTLALSTWSGIKISPLNYVILYPALIMGLELLFERWKKRAYGFIISILALLFLANWGIYFLTMSASLKAGVSSFLLIPLPVTVIFLLYWSKWWVRKSNKVEFEPPLIELQKL
jgi:hypothetical protein